MQEMRRKRQECDPWVGKTPWRRAWQPTPVFLLGNSHGQRTLVGYNPWGHEELDSIEQLSMHIYLPIASCKIIGHHRTSQTVCQIDMRTINILRVRNTKPLCPVRYMFLKIFYFSNLSIIFLKLLYRP